MSDLEGLSEGMAAAVERAQAAVARVEGRCHSSSATAWGEDVLIAAHHALPRDEVSVTLADGARLDARVVARDAGTDVAVLKVEGAKLSPPEWGDDSALKVGQVVLPLARTRDGVRATFGMIASLGGGFRTMAGGSVDRYIDVDGSLPRGFSGGPLIDARGRAIGMNTQALVRGGTTIPASTLRRVVGDLLSDGRVGRGYLGVWAFPVRVPDAVAQSEGRREGVVIAGTEPGGAAEKGGLIAGDIILSVEGVAVAHPRELPAAIDRLANTEVTVRLVRGGEVKEVRLTLGARK